MSRSGTVRAHRPWPGLLVAVVAIVVACGSDTKSDEGLVATTTDSTTTAGPTTDSTTTASTTTASTTTASTTTTSPTTTSTTTTSPTTASTTTTSPTTASTTTPVPETVGPLPVVVAGDSTGRIVAEGLTAVADGDGSLNVTTATRNGCGLLTEGALLDPLSDTFREVPLECIEQIEQVIPDAIATAAEESPAVVVLVVTSWDVSVRRWADGVETIPTDPEHAERLLTGYGSLTDALLGAGATQVHWVLPPTPDGFWTGRGEGQDDDAWQEVSRQVFRTLAADDERVRVRDLVGWMAAEGVLRSPQFRPDGIHLDPEAAVEVGSWMRDELLAERPRPGR